LLGISYTSEAKNALTGIYLYIDINDSDVDSYFTLINGLSDFADISIIEKRFFNVYFDRNIYMKNDCANSILGIRKKIFAEV